MLKNFKIIIFLIAISTSFIVARAIGEGNQNFQTSDSLSSNVLQSISGDLENKNGGTPAVFSDGSLFGGPENLASIKCGDDLALSAKIAFIKFLDDNNKIYKYNIGSRWPIASITKLMTAVIAEENIDFQKPITLTDQMILAEGGAGNFKSGEIYKGGDLVKAMLMLSSNDAAEALAQDFSRDKFIELMNQKARDLNLNDTSYFDPTGLSPKNQSTPDDIFKLAAYIYQNHPDLLKITTQKSQYIIELKSKTKKFISNINEFAGQADFIGGKTGFIDESQGNLLSLFSIKKEPAAIIVFGSQDRFGDTRKLLECAQNQN